MKKLIFLLLAVMLLTACGQDKENNQGAAYLNITAEEAKQIMDSEEGYIILDVRTQEEYDEGHIPGDIVISHEEVAEKAERIISKNVNEMTANVLAYFLKLIIIKNPSSKLF